MYVVIIKPEILFKIHLVFITNVALEIKKNNGWPLS